MNKTVRLLLVGLVALSAVGCAQRYTVASQDLMRGQVVDNVYVRTADGYEYHFNKGVVEGGTFVGTLIEEVETLGDDGSIFVANEVREVRLPISTVIEVEREKRVLSSNTLYVAGMVGAGAIIYAAVTGVEQSDSRNRGSGPAIKQPQD